MGILDNLPAKVLAADKLPTWFPVHHFNEPSYNYTTGVELVDWRQPSLWIALGMILFNPVYWNLVARNEHKNRTLTHLFRSPLHGCYALALSIFLLGLARDTLFESALRAQPHLAILSHPLVKLLAFALIGLGQTLVWTSIYALGITGTYLGDYFGILMKTKVDSFPFNVLSDPMYVGSTMAFVGGAMLYQSAVGLGLSAVVGVTYAVALRFETPFTNMIYSTSAKKRAPTTTSTPARKSSRVAAPKDEDSAPATSKRRKSVKSENPVEVKVNGAAPVASTTSTPRKSRKATTGTGTSPHVTRSTRSRSKTRRGKGTDTE